MAALVDMGLARAGMAILALTFVLGGAGVINAVAAVALFGTVFAAVYHAEVIAHASASRSARWSLPWRSP